MKATQTVSPNHRSSAAAPGPELSLEASRSSRFAVEIFDDICSASVGRWIHTHLNGRSRHRRYDSDRPSPVFTTVERLLVHARHQTACVRAGLYRNNKIH